MNNLFGSIKGKRVLITGASSGIGAETAVLFGEYGAFVGVHFRRDKKSALAVLAKIKKLDGDGEVFGGDLLNKNIRQGLIRSFIKKFGGIDILINNAGAIYNYQPFAEIQERDFDEMFTLHAKVPFILSREAFKDMAKRKWGRIINISTNAIKYAGPNVVHYCASKAALEAVSAGFAREGAKDNVLVNVIRCGFIDTPMHTKTPGYDKRRFQERIKMIPLGRAGRPDDIAHLAVFLASKCGDFITGEVFTVAGGE